MNSRLIKTRAGFSLIELSIAIVILGLALSSALSMWKIHNTGRGLNVTKDKLHRAEIALQAYAEMNGSYPCPASRTARPGDADFGKAVENCRTGDTGKSDNKGIVTATGRSNRNVSIGILPFRSLGMPDAEAVDGWGSLLQYAVTEKLTNPASFYQRDGAIDVIAEDSQSRLKPPGSAQYVVFSSGADAAGGYSNTGAALKKCPVNVLQTKNCDDDAVFIDAAGSFVAPAKDKKKAVAAVVNNDDLITYLQYDPKLHENTSIVYYYPENCMAGFEEVHLKEDTMASDVETLSKYAQSDEGYAQEAASSKKVLCASTKFSQKMVIGSTMSKEQKSNCPDGWTSIGYSIFAPGVAFNHEVCAR